MLFQSVSDVCEKGKALMILFGCCVVRTAVYCLGCSIVGSELSIKMFSVYDSDLLLPVRVICEFCLCVCQCFSLLCIREGVCVHCLCVSVCVTDSKRNVNE